jgi:uncharacterized membrane protein
MDPVTVSALVGRPREEVYAYLSDVANHPEFTDHFLKDWHLTREQSHGVGAGARFRVDAPLARFSWADFTVAEAEAPYRLLLHGRGGKFNRIRQRTEWRLTPGSGNTTRVEVTIETLPVLPSDRVLEVFAGRRWFKRRFTKALRRLSAILEEDRDRGQRVTLAGR